jgi:hypothetical protein
MYSKYKSVKTTVKWFKFDSKAEARFYEYLLAKDIEVVAMQPRFILMDGFKHNKETIRKIEYVADFLIRYEWDLLYIDVKWMRTPVFDLKLKLWKRRYGEENVLLIVKSIKDFERQISL